MRTLRKSAILLLKSFVLIGIISFMASCKEDSPTDPTVTDPIDNPPNNPIAVTGISLDKTKLYLAIDGNYTLIATVTPTDATDKTVTWTTNNPTVATVANGLVTPKSVGTVKITAKSGVYTASCTFKIVSTIIPATAISLDPATKRIALNDTFTLTEVLTPTNATVNLTWTSSDTTIATVKDGVVTAKIPGEVTITAKSGYVTGTSTITVLDGVRINGLIWATRNVDTPGTFTVNPEDFGKVYKFNNDTAWDINGSIVGFGASYYYSPGKYLWEVGNDPSPVGWRLPTFYEQGALIDVNYSTKEYITQNGVVGCKITDKATNASIFLPAAGHIWLDDTLKTNISHFGGAYWSSTGNSTDSWLAASMTFGTSSFYYSVNLHRADGLSIRSVTE